MRGNAEVKALFFGAEKEHGFKVKHISGSSWSIHIGQFIFIVMPYRRRANLYEVVFWDKEQLHGKGRFIRDIDEFRTVFKDCLCKIKNKG